jgi:hypothetical protein
MRFYEVAGIDGYFGAVGLPGIGWGPVFEAEGLPRLVSGSILPLSVEPQPAIA